MKGQQPGWARISPLIGSRAAFAAILLLAHLFPIAARLRGQSVSSGLTDPFGGVEKRLGTAADAQLILFRDANRVAASPVPRSLEITWSADADSWHGFSGLRLAKRTKLWERRREELGTDARRILAEEGLPVELLAVAKVESNFNTFAVSPKGAVGLWQFMAPTARRYGLRVDAVEDERFDAAKSTRAAGRYLRDLYIRFGNWPLALAAYNAGEDAVQRAIDHAPDRNFNSISRVELLPAETRAYVPAVLKVIGSRELERNASRLPVGMN